jgi:hypothetical protein
MVQQFECRENAKGIGMFEGFFVSLEFYRHAKMFL